MPRWIDCAMRNAMSAARRYPRRTLRARPADQSWRDGTIEAWRNRPIEGEHPYVYLDGIVLKRRWAGEARNVSLLVAIGVNESGYRRFSAFARGRSKTSWLERVPQASQETRLKG